MSKITTRTAAVASTAAALIVASSVPAFAAPGVPNPSPGLPNGIQGKLDTLVGMFMSFVLVACVVGVLICAAKLALAIRHGEAGEAAGKLGAVGVACILVGSGSAIVNYLV